MNPRAKGTPKALYVFGFGQHPAKSNSTLGRQVSIIDGCLYMGGILLIYGWYTAYIWVVYCLYTAYKWVVYCLYMGGILLIYGWYTAYIWVVYCLYMGGILLINGWYTAYILLINGWYTAYNIAYIWVVYTMEKPWGQRQWRRRSPQIPTRRPPCNLQPPWRPSSTLCRQRTQSRCENSQMFKPVHSAKKFFFLHFTVRYSVLK